jgi:heptosyltransferase-3
MTRGPAPKERLACLVVAHNLGDAVIQSRFLRELAARGYAQRYLVWTRPQVAFLFADIADCEVVCSQFPVGTAKQMGGTAVFAFLKAAWQVRRRRPSVTLDLIGDLRDRLFAHLAGTPRHLHIGWAEGHPFNRLIRNPWGAGKPFLTVPREVRNVYAAHDLVLQQLAPPVAGSEPDGRRHTGPAANASRALKVGLHPFASQRCKLWPRTQWQQLTRSLLARGAEVTAFGAPADTADLQDMFVEFGGDVRLVAGTISQFADEVARLDAIVGLDSFAVHMAQRQGVRSVTINAGNPPELWAPPEGRSLGSSGGCPQYPCFNVPTCEGTPLAYACVRSIDAEQVEIAVLGEGVAP